MEGVRAELHPELGRVLRATRAFAQYDVVLAEPPLLMFQPTAADPAGFRALLAAFRAAAPAVQSRILDLAHLPLDTPSAHVRQRSSEAAQLCRQIPIPKLLTISS